jgi:polysaccharide biosynthesis protein PslE
MDFLQIDGKEIPLLEPPESHRETPRRLLHVLFKYKRLILWIFLSISLSVLAGILIMPERYRASAKIFIKPSRSYLNLTPGRSGDSFTMFPSPDVLNSEIQVIRSRELAEQLKKELPFPDKDWLSTGSPFALTAVPIRSTNIIEVSLVSTNPEWAMLAVNRAAELYQSQHVKIHQTQGVEKFYDEQEKKLMDQLTRAAEALKQFQKKENIIDAPKEVDADLAALAAFQRALNETNSGIRETEQKVAVLDEQLKQQKATISSNTNITVNPVYQQVQAKLTQLELERDGLLQRYTSEDRLVKDKQKEIDELKKSLEKVKPTSVGSENVSLNDVHRRILNELLQGRVLLRSLNEKKSALTQQVGAYSAAAADKQRKGFEYDRLLSEVNAKRDSLKLYMQKAEEARISNAMDVQNFGNSAILEKASLPLPFAGRSIFVWLFVVGFASLTISVSVAFLINYFDPALQDEVDVEAASQLPVLATIQHYQSVPPDYYIPAT